MQKPNTCRISQINKLIRKHDFLVQDPEMASKFVKKDPLAKEDIERTAKTFEEHFRAKIFVTSSTTNFREILRKVIPLTVPVAILHKLQQNEWALMYITVKNFDTMQYKVLYKNGNGSPVSKDIKNELKQVLPSVNIVFHRSEDCSDENFSALTCLLNLKILLKLNRDEKLESVKFASIKFCDNAEIIQTQLHSLLNVYLPQISSKEGFLLMLKDFIENIPVDLVEGMEKFDEIVTATNDENDDVAAERIRDARKVLFDRERLKKFSDKYCGENSTDLLIEKKFPVEMEVLKRIFELLQILERDEAFEGIIRHISNQLKIDYQKLILFYKVNRKEEVEQRVAEEVEKTKNNFSVMKIEHIIHGLPRMMRKWEPDTSAKHWTELLEEVKEKFEKSFTEKCSCIFRTLDDKRNKKWFKKFQNQFINSRLLEIEEWALHQRESKKKIDYGDFVVKLDEVYYAITGDKRLRYSQILALLVFAFGESGKLCQIETGEGKTLIVALIAILKALTGHNVDIITSSPILANEAVEQMQNFYNMFGLSVAANVDNNNQCIGNYKADVLYGTIGGFQFDYLTEQLDGGNIRSGRKFDVVILDEVDSMLVDNGEHIAQIATTFPGMESLRYLYIKVWDEVTKPNWDKNEDELISKMEKEVENMKYLIPGHLVVFASSQVKPWVKNAVYAKNHCYEFQQYRVQATGSNLGVVPIDYLNTGVAMKNLVWSAGLTQFIELKHDLHLSSENLTSCFISNIGFIHKYQSKNIYGLSGTLGSEKEQNLLYDLYKVTFATLPTYKVKKFQEITGQVGQNELHWKYLVAVSAINNCQKGRATLIVCKTQDDVIKLQAMFHIIKHSKNFDTVQKTATLLHPREALGVKNIIELICAKPAFNLRKYSSEEDIEQTKKELKPGDIILATNIAGRGTDFKTSKKVEDNGGLHVCVSFLPKNKRVEDQAFGRTSRQGKSGTAQLIIKREEIELLEIKQNSSFTEIKAQRDKTEGERLKEIQDVSVKELMFKDKLFELFSRDFKILTEKFTESKDRFLLEDYKECFALWFETNFKVIVTKMNETKAEEEYEKFKKKASDIAEGKIKHNPFNYLSIAFHYSDKLKNDTKAKEMLMRAVDICESAALMHGTYIKLAQFSIESSPQVTKRIKNIFKKLIFLEESKDHEYKEDALNFLEKAKEILDQEVKELQRFLASIENNEISAIKYVDARLCQLKIYQQNTEDQIQELKKSKEDKEYDVIYRFKISARVTCQVTEELKKTGLDTFYALQKIHEIPNLKIKFFQGEIVSAFVALGIGCCFPPALPKMISLATSLAIDVLQEIIMEMLTGSNEEFDQRAYIYKKSIRLATIAIIAQGSLLIKGKKITLGIFAVKYIMRTCTQNMSPEFRNSYPVCTSVLDGCVDFIEDYQWAAQLRSLPIDKWGAIWENMKNNGLSVTILVTLGTKVFSNDVVFYLTKSSTATNIKKVMAPVIYKYLTKNIIMGHINMCVFHKIDDNDETRKTKTLLKRKLETTPKEKIDDVVRQYLHGKFVFNVNFTEVLTFFTEMYQMWTGPNETSTDILGMPLEFFKMMRDDSQPITTKLKEKGMKILKNNICIFGNLEFKEKLQGLFAHLSKELPDNGKENNVVSIVCENIAKAVFDRVFFANI